MFRRSSFGIIVLAAAFASCISGPRAAAQSWTIEEIFTNATGTIQFLELTTTAASDFALNGLSLTATSDGVPAVFNFTHNLSGQPTTTDRTFLLATANFAALPGAVTPDFGTLPSRFFDPDAASITLDFAGLSLRLFGGSTTPKNGVKSLNYHIIDGHSHIEWADNTPTNFAGAVGSIDVSPQLLAGDFDGSGEVNSGDLFLWGYGFGFTTGADPFDGDADRDHDVDGMDLLVWQKNFGMSESTAAVSAAAGGVPEPAAALLAIVAAGAMGLARRWAA